MYYAYLKSLENMLTNKLMGIAKSMLILLTGMSTLFVLCTDALLCGGVRGFPSLN